jgi:hypothetical protein
MGGARRGGFQGESKVNNINPSLGSCGYWHLVTGGPEGPDEQAVDQLLEIVRNNKERSSSLWPIPPIIVRAMAFELTVASAFKGRQLTNQLVELLAWSTELPEAFLWDPAAFFAGGWKGGRPSNNARAKGRAGDKDRKPHNDGAKVRACWLDREHYQGTGDWLPLLTLHQRLEGILGEGMAPARSTLKKWRSEADYAAWVTFDPETNCSEINGES